MTADSTTNSVSLFLRLSLTFLLLTGRAATSQGQFKEKEDSLKSRLIEMKTSVDKYNTLMALASLHHINNPNDGQGYIKEALEVAKELNYERGITEASISKAYLDIRSGKFTSVKPSLDKALEISKKKNWMKLQGKAFDCMGLLYGELGKLDSSIIFFRKSLQLLKSCKSDIDVSNTFANLGIALMGVGKYESAFKHMLEAFRIAEKIKNEPLLANIHYELGSMYLDLGEFDKAKSHAEKSLQLYEKLNYEYGLSRATISLGCIYHFQGEIDEAAKYYKRSAEISERINAHTSLIHTLINIGVIHMDKKEYNLAEKYYKKSLSVADESGFKEGQASAFLNLSELFTHTNEFDKALTYIAKSLELFNEMNDQKGIKDGFETKTRIYEKMGNYELAMKNYIKYREWQDSLSNEASNNKIHELEIQYETEKKDNQIKTLSQQAEVQQLKNERQHFLLVGFISFAFVLLLLGYLLYAQKVLKARQKNVELEQKLLLSQMNPHFIFNALTAIQHYLFSHSPVEAGKYLSKFAKLMRLILENSREKYVTLDKEIATLSHYLELQSLRFQNKFSYEIFVDPQLNTETVLIPPMFAQPLIENSLEHGILHKNDHGRIFIRFFSKDNMIHLEVEDNGIGQERARQFKQIANVQHKSLATQITQERLLTINKRKAKKVELNIIDLLDDQNNVQGTRATFAIPFQTI